MAVDLQVPIASEDDIVLARQRAREMARDLGFGLVDQSRIATAVSELARNMVRYATECPRRNAGAPAPEPPGAEGIEIVVADEGPGIADMEPGDQPGLHHRGWHGVWVFRGPAG